MDCHQFTNLAQQYPRELELLKGRELPAISFSNIFGEDILPNFYERIRAGGYHREADHLGAIIEMRRPVGYGNGTGSMERVRFFVDWRHDGNFVPALPPTGEVSFVAHDKECIEQTPVAYMVCAHGFCRPPDVPIRPAYPLRIILSWQDEIAGPDFAPNWGDRFECRISFDDPHS